MIKVATKTKMDPAEIIKQAVAFFGPDGYKLDIREQTDNGVSFEGGGGSVEISACPEEKSTSLEISSREWDYQVKEFIGNIK